MIDVVIIVGGWLACGALGAGLAQWWLGPPVAWVPMILTAIWGPGGLLGALGFIIISLRRDWL